MSTPEQDAKFVAFIWDVTDHLEAPTRFGQRSRTFSLNPWAAWLLSHIRKAGKR